MTKISISKDDLLSYYRMALRNGTTSEFDDLLSEWLEKATEEIDRLRVEVEAMKHRLLIAEAKAENAVRKLSGIHALLYPPPISTPDGRTMVFRPEHIDPHEVLQELSDRIRSAMSEGE